MSEQRTYEAYETPSHADMATAGKYGNYGTPRECPCGEKHLDRETYWLHRLDAEEARA